MYKNLLTHLAVVLLSLGTTSLAIPTGSPDPINLLPLDVKDYEAATGLHARADGSFEEADLGLGDLDLGDSAHLVYGAVDSTSTSFPLPLCPPASPLHCHSTLHPHL